MIATRDQPRRPRRSRSISLLLLVLGSLGGVALVPLLAQQPPDRTRPPQLGPPPPLNLPPIQKRALSNGLPVWVIETHEVPIAQVNLVVMAGSGDDPAGKFGTASLTAAMLDEGAGARSALEIADAVEFLGADLTTTSSFDASAVRLNVPAARLNEALPIMADVALRPVFSDEELNRLRQDRLTALLQARDDPPSIAARAFSRIVFGNAHRYGTGPAGTESTLKTLSTQNLKAFHSTFFQPTNAVLVVVGDVRVDAVVAALEKHFGAWKASVPVTHVEVPSAQQLTTGQIYIVDKPGAEQSQIRIGWVGVPRNNPDFFPLQVLNTVLGGSFTSRLNQNLREEHGYAYGASSAFDMRLSAGPFVAAAGVQTDKTAESVREFFNELNAITKPIPAGELAKAKNYIALGFPSDFETTRDLAGNAEQFIVYTLPDDYVERYVANIQAVTADAVQKVAMKYIQPTKFAVVIVGDRKTIEPGVRALKLLPVRVMTVDEALGS